MTNIISQHVYMSSWFYRTNFNMSSEGIIQSSVQRKKFGQWRIFFVYNWQQVCIAFSLVLEIDLCLHIYKIRRSRASSAHPPRRLIYIYINTYIYIYMIYIYNEEFLHISFILASLGKKIQQRKNISSILNLRYQF